MLIRKIKSLRDHFALSNVPFKSRQSYYYEMISGIFEAVYVAIVFNLLIFIANKTIHVSETQLSIIMVGLFTGSLVGTIAPMMLRFSKKKHYVVLSGILTKGFLIVCGFVDSPSLFTWVSFIVFITGGLGVSAYAGIVGTNYPNSVRNSILGKIRTLHTFVVIIVAYIMGKVLEADENYYKILFPISGVCGLISTYFFSKVIVRDERRKNYDFQKPLFAFKDLYRVIREDKRFRRYENYYSLGGVAIIMLGRVFVPYITDELHADYDQIAKVAAVFKNIAIVLTLALWGKFMDKNDNPIYDRIILIFIFMCEPIIYFISHNIYLVYIGSIIAAVAHSGGMLNWLLSPLYFCKPKDNSLYSAVHTLYNGFRGLIAPFLAQYLCSFVGIRNSFFVLALLMLLSGLLFIRFYQEEKAALMYQRA